MAKLHRRIPQLPNPHLSACGALSVFLLGTLPGQLAEAQEDHVARLATLSEQLASSDTDERHEAAEALSTLSFEMVPAIDARLERLARGRPPNNWVDDLLNRFRRRGARGEGEAPNLVVGVIGELDQTHRPRIRRHVLRMAEPLLLWHALEHMQRFEADQVAYRVIGYDNGRWMPEARNWVRRRGTGVMAAAIAARSNDDRFVRRWSRWAIPELHADQPGRAVQGLEPEVLPGVLRAYAMIRMQSAMPIIVSYVDSERRRVRLAARWAMERYGGNAIWILRTAYHTETSESAPSEWGWRRLTERLYGRIDARRMAPVQAALVAGLAARADGSFELMRERFDEVLARSPEIEAAGEVAAGYAEMAAAASSEGRLAQAEDSFLRALRLAPESESAGVWRVQLRLVQAEQDRARGLLDFEAYSEVLEARPGEARASEAIDSAQLPDATLVSSRQRSWGLFGSVLLLLLGAGLIWRRPRRKKPTEPVAEEDRYDALLDDERFYDDDGLDVLDDTLDAPTFDEADSTLPDVVPDAVGF